LESRILIEQATGFLAERHRLNVAIAFDRLRSNARSNGRPLTDVARDVSDGTLDLT
jgi:AmiR/NasT family two-component response regulator